MDIADDTRVVHDTEFGIRTHKRYSSCFICKPLIVNIVKSCVRCWSAKVQPSPLCTTCYRQLAEKMAKTVETRP